MYIGGRAIVTGLFAPDMDSHSWREIWMQCYLAVNVRVKLES